MSALLAVEDLTVSFAGTPVVEGVGLTVGAGEIVGLVGESGSGKSVTALSILRLLDGARLAGRVMFEGNDLLAADERALRRVRGNRIGMVFQDPLTSLNPVLTIGEQVAEVVRVHERASRKAAWARAVEMLALTGIPSPAERAHSHPHELSGGMRQRAMIAMALVCRPALLVADEPTTALDVTVQAQILALLRRLQRELGMAVLLITHDLAVVAETCDRVSVMYAGRIVEEGPVGALFASPRHPYTLGLLGSIPGVDDVVDASGRRRLRAIPGSVPVPGKHPTGCRFRDRCSRAVELCAAAEPELFDVGGAQRARCVNMVPSSRMSA